MLNLLFTRLAQAVRLVTTTRSAQIPGGPYINQPAPLAGDTVRSAQVPGGPFVTGI